jgi:hypothetical protein
LRLIQPIDAAPTRIILQPARVAERRRKRPASEFERGLHARAHSIRSHVVVELRESRQHTFHQLAGGGVVDRLGG